MPFIRFQHRRDSASLWVTNNPLLASGEMGIETDTSLFKIGNGTTSWIDLPYGGMKGATGPQSTVTGPTGPQSTVTGPTGPQSTVTGPTGPQSTVTGPTGPAGGGSTVSVPNGAILYSADGVSINGSQSMTFDKNVISRGFTGLMNLAADVNVEAGITSMFLQLTALKSNYYSNSGVIWYNALTNLAMLDDLALNVSSRDSYQVVVTKFAGVSASNVSNGQSGGFVNPTDLAIDSAGNLYICDPFSIKKITPAGFVSTFAGAGFVGTADGTGIIARFNGTWGITIDLNNNLYVCDSSNHRIRKITPEGVVTTIAGSTSGYLDGQGTAAQFNTPYGITIDLSGNLYVSDYYNDRIRKITPEGVVTTFAGGTYGYLDGQGTAARFIRPWGITIDLNNNLYVCDTGNHRIRKITPEGVVTTIAGSTSGYLDGQGTAAQFNAPRKITIDLSGNLYVSDVLNHRIRKITPTGLVTTFAGSNRGNTDGGGTASEFNSPSGITIDSSGNLYICDTGNFNIRKITFLSSGASMVNYKNVTTFAGSTSGYLDGQGTASRFSNLSGITIDLNNNLYVCDTGNQLIRKITPEGVVTTIAGTGSQGYQDQPPLLAQFNAPTGITIDSSGNLYVCDSVNRRIRKIPVSGSVTSLTINEFTNPQGIIIDSANNLYVCDSNVHSIKKLTPEGVVTTFAGTNNTTFGYVDGQGSAAQFNKPHGITIDSSGNFYVCDRSNHRIRKITPAGVVTTFAGGAIGYYDDTGTASRFSYPEGITIDLSGNLYVCDSGNARIRKITPEGVVTTFAGGSAGYRDGAETSCQFNYPRTIAINSFGDFYVADAGNNRIRKITAS